MEYPLYLRGRSFQVDLEEAVTDELKRYSLQKFLREQNTLHIGPVSTLTDPVISCVQASTPSKTNLSRKNCNSGSAIGDSKRKQVALGLPLQILWL